MRLEVRTHAGRVGRAGRRVGRARQQELDERRAVAGEERGRRDGDEVVGPAGGAELDRHPARTRDRVGDARDRRRDARSGPSPGRVAAEQVRRGRPARRARHRRRSCRLRRRPWRAGPGGRRRFRGPCAAWRGSARRGCSRSVVMRRTVPVRAAWAEPGRPARAARAPIVGSRDPHERMRFSSCSGAGRRGTVDPAIDGSGGDWDADHSDHGGDRGRRTARAGGDRLCRPEERSGRWWGDHHEQLHDRAVQPRRHRAARLGERDDPEQRAASGGCVRDQDDELRPRRPERRSRSRVTWCTSTTCC